MTPASVMPAGAVLCVSIVPCVSPAVTRRHAPQRRPVVFHELCRCRQAACTDPETEQGRIAFLSALAEALKAEPVSFPWSVTGTAATATSTITPAWSTNP